MDDLIVKQEKGIFDLGENNLTSKTSEPIQVIDIPSSTDDDDDEDDDDDDDDESRARGSWRKRARVSGEGGTGKERCGGMGVVLPLGFLDPLSPEEESPPVPDPGPILEVPLKQVAPKSCKQFWKAADYAEDCVVKLETNFVSAGMDHVRVHPRFLHSNATSHKWVLGAFAELLDNSLDEVCYGATFVNIDVLENKKDKKKVLLIEDNGGGMDPNKMRQCMSLGYSAKSNMANTIGQYGNGFKTSTMRLGADVIVFSRCLGEDGKRQTQSIGLLSYTFLTSTGKEDIVVPMLDYEKDGKAWKNIIRSSSIDWNRNVETIVQWSPFLDEDDLLQQFNSIKDHGTRIFISNLWEDEEGELELDFRADCHDIQIRGVNRDEKEQMAQHFPHSRHFLTYQHSLRSYASILYLRLPPGFRIILRGIDIQHHNIIDDMMLIEDVTYRPQPIADGVSKDQNIAVGTIGFAKDSQDHINIQGFNVYHKNRLIKPFWRVWNVTGSDGRGVIGVLEANFVEPAHNKQGFERTPVLQKFENRLIIMQKAYWNYNCHRIGYAPRPRKKIVNCYQDKETSPEAFQQPSSHRKEAIFDVPPISKELSDADQCQYPRRSERVNKKHSSVNKKYSSGLGNGKAASNFGNKPSTSRSASDGSDQEPPLNSISKTYSQSFKASPAQKSSKKETYNTPPSLAYSVKQSPILGGSGQVSANTRMMEFATTCRGNEPTSSNLVVSLEQLESENRQLKDRLKKMEESILDLQIERDRSRSLEAQVHELEHELEESNREQEALIDVFSEERSRRDKEEETLRNQLKEASAIIHELLEKLRFIT